MALFALLSWWVQEKYKITLQKNKISKLIQEINRALQPAFSTNLDPREIAKIKEEILDTSVCEDVKLLKESIYNLASFKSVSSEVISASSNLYNTLYAKRDLIDCQPHLNTLIIFFK
jgi:hypothetical protein